MIQSDMQFKDRFQPKKKKSVKKAVFIAGAATGAAAIVATGKLLSKPENRKKAQKVLDTLKKGRDRISNLIQSRNEIKETVQPVQKTVPAVKRAVKKTAKKLSTAGKKSKK